MIANIFGVDGGIVLLIALVVLVGGSQLPKIARNVGLAGKEFRKAHDEAEADAQQKEAAKTPAAAATTTAGAAAPAPQQLATVAPTTEQSVTLSRSELDALLRAREEQVRREGTDPSGSSS
jgi:sec-independent protein translocase protein TatA